MVFLKYYRQLDGFIYFYDAYVQKVLYNIENILYRINIDNFKTIFSYKTSFNQKFLNIKKTRYLKNDRFAEYKLKNELNPLD